MSIKITGTGSYIPLFIKKNEDFLKVEINWFETTKSGWIEESDN